jgi:hypothetical protein
MKRSYQRGGKAARAFLFAAALLTLLATAYGDLPTARATGKPATWKPLEQALLRMDDHPVAADWNVYEAGKKLDPLLLQIGGRFLYIVLRDHQIYEIDPAKIHHKGDDLLWDPSDRPAMPLETAEWGERDIGLAFKISVKLVAASWTCRFPTCSASPRPATKRARRVDRIVL